MVNYKYTVLTHDGRKITGVSEGFNEAEVTAKIRAKYDRVLSIRPIKVKSGFLGSEIGREKVNGKAFILMCRQFATTLKSGIPIGRVVNLVAEKTTDKPLKKILQAVAVDVEAGRPISASFEEQGGSMMPPTFVETVRAGEESGSLPNSFESLYKHFDKQAKMAAKVRGAMAYPLFVLAVAVVVVVVLMIRVVPTFLSIYESYDADLPGITKALLYISNFVKVTLPFFAILVIAGLIAFRVYKSSEKGAIEVAKLKLKLPVLGNIEELNASSQFANSMATMTGAGLPVTKAVSITSKVIENAFISDKVRGMTARIEEGRSIGDALRETEVMPGILTDMVAVGDETGEMQEALDTVAVYYDDELDQAVQDALAKLGPALLVILAGIVGFIVIAIYMSMFEMYNYM